MNKAKYLLQKAKDEHFAIGAFNAANLETLKAITNAAKALSSPVLIEASKGEIDFFGMKNMVDVVRNLEKENNIPIILNLDHGQSLEYCIKAIDLGFDYVHFDGSSLDIKENIKITKEVVTYAHRKDIPVEGEMDHIEGSSEDHTKENPSDYQKPQMYTIPENAQAFVNETGIDVFAAFFGNLHGVFSTSERLRLDIFQQIIAKLPNTYFSLHGGSGINNDDVAQAVKLGIVKVNINSEMRIAYKMTLQETLNKSQEVATYKFEQDAIMAVQKVVETKIKLFGSQGKI